MAELKPNRAQNKEKSVDKTLGNNFAEMRLEQLIKRFKPNRSIVKEMTGKFEDWQFIKWVTYEDYPISMLTWSYDLVLFYQKDTIRALLVWQGIPFDGKDQYHIRTLKGKVQLNELTRMCLISGSLK